MHVCTYIYITKIKNYVFNKTQSQNNILNTNLKLTEILSLMLSMIHKTISYPQIEDTLFWWGFINKKMFILVHHYHVFFIFISILIIAIRFEYYCLE